MTAFKSSNDDNFTSSGSDDFLEFFLSSSNDRSSVGSIPWAEDAIKQNQLEWERVERMFYGEEELPEDPDLRREILEWNKVFPHFRVNGERIQTKGNNNAQKRCSSTPKTKEEIISIHPNKSTHSNIRKSDEMCKKTNTRSAGIVLKPLSLEEYFAKDLQIRSVPMLTKKSYSIPKIASTEIVPNSRFNALQNSTFRQSIPWKSSGSLLLQRSVPKASNSAKIIRIPPIIIVPPQPQQNSATIRRNPKSTIILPSINVNRVQLCPLDNTSRSANAAHQKYMPTSHFPFSASKFKYSK